MSDRDTNQDMKKRKKKKKRSIVKTIFLTLFVIILLGGVAAGGVAAKIVTDIYKSTEDFNINSLISKSASVMSYYDKTTGEWKDFEYVGTTNTGTRTNVYYEDLPQVLVDAVIATEDSRFYTHKGFDLPRIVKAFYSLATSGEISSGGSTITQQLIKNAYYLSEEHINTDKWERKIGEIILALRVEQKVSKEDILVNYLNMIQFGNGLNTLGISAASNYYFDKDVQDLTLPEAALLAGTLNQPSKYDPYYNLEGANERRNTVLELMARHGYITREEAEAAKAIPVENYLKRQSSSSTTSYTAYQSYYDNVLAELNDLGIDPYTDSVRIYTNMDVDLQEYVETIGEGELFAWNDDVLETSMTLVETHTGKVLCTLAGREYVGHENPLDVSPTRTNRSREKHQPGSSLKPIVAYAAAFEFLNWSTGHYISNETFDTGYGVQIHNWDGSKGGELPLTQALAQSYNNPAMYTAKDVRDEIGYDAYVNYLSSFGFDMENEEFDIQYSIGGWKYGVTSPQLAAAYGALSNEGSYIEPHFIYKIEYLDSNREDRMVTDEAIQNQRQVVSAESAFMIRQAMLSYKGRYTGMNIPYNACAKSGTTTYDDSLIKEYGLGAYANKDYLMNAFTEDYAVSVWVGYDVPNYIVALKESYGVYPGIAAGALLTRAHNGATKNAWSQPEGVVQTTMVAGLSDPYVKPDSSTPSSMILTAWFKTSNVPQAVKVDTSTPNLSSFTAKYDDNAGEITVKFAKFPEDANSQGTKHWGTGLYCVNIVDAITGKVIDTVKKEDASYTIKYKASDDFKVVGYYARKKNTNMTSNTITVDIEVTGSSKSSATIAYSTLNAGLELSPRDLLTALGAKVIYKGDDVTMDATVTGTIDWYTPGSYTIKISYKDFTSDAFTITLEGSSTPEHETPEPEEPHDQEHA